ncbi:MAG: ATP-grasp domain-containing protein [Microthrixaceae bacterium]|nr:ATP-grasp domain-containing protein [Microthrixaceae bacterium]
MIASEPGQRTERPTPCVLLAEEVWGSTLHAIRSLGRTGVPVFVITAGQGSTIYRWSRFCVAAQDITTSDPVAFMDRTRAWLDQETSPDAEVVVIPLSDRLVEYLHKTRGSTPERWKVSIPTPSVTETLLDKALSLQVAERAGLEVPPWMEVRSVDDIATTSDLVLPVVVRPTRWSSTGEDYFKVKLCHTEDQLQSVMTDAIGTGAELIVQSYINAPDEAVEFAISWRSNDRSTTASCTGRKRRQSGLEGGVMAWGETVDLPDVATGAVQFLDESGFTGLGGIEFIRSDGHLWFIEFNPRLEAIHFLATAAGVDTVLMEYNNRARGSVPPVIPVQSPAAGWVGSAWLNRLNHRPGDWRVALTDRRAFARAQRRIKAVMDPRDPLPAAMVLARLVSRGLRRVSNRRSS